MLHGSQLLIQTLCLCLQNGGGLSRPLQGVPMVASSPVRHEPPLGMQGNPVEVQSYQTPWKALSEFAMQGDMDQPHAPFQQLVSNINLMTNNNNNNTFLQHQQHNFHHISDYSHFNSDSKLVYGCYTQHGQLFDRLHSKHHHHQHPLNDMDDDDDDDDNTKMMIDEEDDTVVYLEDQWFFVSENKWGPFTDKFMSIIVLLLLFQQFYF